MTNDLSMTPLDDSGNRALAGYFFQLIGSGGQTLELLGPVEGDGGTLEATFAVVGLEELGQDAIAQARVEGEPIRTEITQYKLLVISRSSPNPA